MIEQMISKVWALEPRFNEVQAALMLRRLQNGQQLDGLSDAWAKKREAVQPYLSHRDAYGVYRVWDYAQAKNGQGVAVIPIIGSMSRYGDMCSYGSEDIASWVQEANEASYVNSIVLEINSPGGEVDGTELLGAVVKNSAKPVVAYVAGMAASAAYWVASQAREIVMESETTSEVGSIGVLAMHIDASKYYEQEGFKVSILRSDGSEDKALFNSVEPLTEDLVKGVKGELNLIRSTFIKAVKAGRPGIADDVFSGKMYHGREAIKKGMADRIGYLGDAIQRADLLARKAV